MPLICTTAAYPPSRPSLDYYDRGGNRSKGKSPFIYKIGLATREKRDLLELLQTLNEPDDHPKFLRSIYNFCFHFLRIPFLKGKACSIF
jgi:hypothetical protein